jgi:formylglycine-generating enzyme required for sulfatase activity
MCEGQSRQTIVCNEYDPAVFGGEITPDDIRPTGGSRKVARGGSVAVVQSQACDLRAIYRDGRFEPTRQQPFIGFRCARSL